MAILDQFLSAGAGCPAHRPWPRAVVDVATWTAAAMVLGEERCTLLGL